MVKIIFKSLFVASGYWLVQCCFADVVTEVQRHREWITCDVYIWASLQQRIAKLAQGITLELFL